MATSCCVLLCGLLWLQGLGTSLAPCVHLQVCECVYVGQGDASCGSSLNILAGNISDAFPSLFHHFPPSCLPFSTFFSASSYFVRVSPMKRKTLFEH